MAKNLPFVIIGAGPSGLATARNLARYDLPFVGFESHSGPGGLWDIENVNSAVYPSTHFISSKRMTEFKEFPMPNPYPSYPSHRQALKYLQRYALHKDLDQYFQYGTKVLSTTPLKSGGFHVKTDSSELEAAGVIVCTGTFNTPSYPPFSENYLGEAIHSKDLKDFGIMKGKRVLVVGGGNSGCDIAVEAQSHARSVDLSMRRGYYFFPKFIAGVPSDEYGERWPMPRVVKQQWHPVLLKWLVGKNKNYNLPIPDHKIYELHPVVNTKVLHHIGHGDIRPRGAVEHCEGDIIQFKGGEKARYDLVVYATGFKLNYPFIDHNLLDWKSFGPDLYLNIFHRKRDDIFFIGLIEGLGLGWEGRFLQAHLVAKYLREKRKASSRYQRFHDKKRRDNPNIRNGYRYAEIPRMGFYVDKKSYIRILKRNLKALNDAG